MSVLTWVHAHWAIIATILFLISELLGESQRIRENSIFGLIREFLQSEAGRGSSEMKEGLEKE